MTDKLHCAHFHEFDGTCCDEDRPCLCERPPVDTAFLIAHNRRFLVVWAANLIFCAAAWVGVLALVCVALGY